MRLAVDQQIDYAHDAAASAGLANSATRWSAALLNNKQETDEEIAQQRALVAELKQRLAQIGGEDAENLVGLGRLPGPQEHLDLRRRRLRLRHRLRRPGPRLRLRPRPEHPRARYRGLLEHRRPGVEGHASRGGGQVRRRRQAGRQEGPGHDRHVVRQGVRRARSPWAPTRCTRSRRSAPPSRIAARRSSSPSRHCIGWGIDMSTGMQHQKEGVACGYWPLYHYDPARRGAAVPPGQPQAGRGVQGFRHEGSPLRHARPLQAAEASGC